MKTDHAPLFSKARNRRERNVIRNEARLLGKQKVRPLGPVIEATVLNDPRPYGELFRTFNLAYINTANAFNAKARAVECDPYWFHKRYRHNWPLRLKRLWRRLIAHLQTLRASAPLRPSHP